MIRSRREFLKAGGAAAAAVLASRCASRVPGYVVEPPSPGRPKPRRLERVNVSEDRIIRRVVGLRPFRPSGFVVRAESLEGKLLVHNYGHGGAGVTLSWGCADDVLVAVEELIESVRRYPRSPGENTATTATTTTQATPPPTQAAVAP